MASRFSPSGLMTGLPARRTGRGKRCAFALIFVLMLQGCATHGGIGQTRKSKGEPVWSLIELRQREVVMQAWDLSCGAAALATLLNFQHGDPVTEHEITRVLIDRDIYLESPEIVSLRQGFSLADLKRFSDLRGYKGLGMGQLSTSDLADLAPLIVPIFENGISHFVVYRGELDSRVLLSDPAFGVRSMKTSTFERLWRPINNAVGRVGFVVRRLDGLAPPNRLEAGPADFVTFG